MLACNETPTPAPESAVAAKVDPRRCQPGPGATGSPSTIQEAVTLANGLPMPVSAECFVEALDRPLKIEASKSGESLQPGEGERSPRVFIWGRDDLVMTIVLDGKGRDLVEFGQPMGPGRSVKAELSFPLTEPTTVAAALDRVRNEEHPRITRCFVCHNREMDEPSMPGARSSLVLRPRKPSVVDIDFLRDEGQRCDDTAEPARCRWLEAIFDHGPVEHRPFDAEVPVM